jgi:hypothetical protein
MGAHERKELATLEAMPDSAIDLSDVPEVHDWNKAEVGRFYRSTRRR